MTPSDGATDPFRVLALDTAEAEYASLRLVAAAATLIGAIGLVALRPDVVGWVCAIAGVAFSAMWIGLWARARRMTGRAEQHFLALAPSGIELSTGAARTEIGWDSVETVRVDEDRLVLEIVQLGGETAKIDPRYGGLGLYDLERAVLAAWEAAGEDAA